MENEKPWHHGKTKADLIEMLEARIIVTSAAGTLVDASMVSLYMRSYGLLGKKPKTALVLTLGGNIKWEAGDANIILP